MRIITKYPQIKDSVTIYNVGCYKAPETKTDGSYILQVECKKNPQVAVLYALLNALWLHNNLNKK